MATFWKWLGPLALLAVLVIGDQIRINRPGHKYRLTVEVETPAGIKSASGVLAVTPDRGYSNRGRSVTSGDASIASRDAVAIAAQSLNDSSSGGVPGRAVPSLRAARRAVRASRRPRGAKCDRSTCRDYSGIRASDSRARWRAIR